MSADPTLMWLQFSLWISWVLFAKDLLDGILLVRPWTKMHYRTCLHGIHAWFTNCLLNEFACKGSCHLTLLSSLEIQQGQSASSVATWCHCCLKMFQNKRKLLPSPVSEGSSRKVEMFVQLGTFLYMLNSYFSRRQQLVCAPRPRFTYWFYFIRQDQVLFSPHTSC